MSDFAVGDCSLGVAQEIVRCNEEIRKLSLVTHDVGLNWAQKYSSVGERIKNFQEIYGLMTPPNNELRYGREDFLEIGLEKLRKMVSGKEVVSFASAVELVDGSKAHVPMMNFHPADGVSAVDIKKLVLHLFPKEEGVLLESGRYYHYYGNFLLTHDEWVKFNAKFMLPFHFVHPGYLGFRLHAGYSTLRLTAEGEYKPKIPRVVHVFNQR